MSMAHSLEVRPPFLDHRIVEFAAKLPVGLKIQGRTTKRVLRELVRQKLPPEILARPKEGLDIPAHEWLRGPLRPLLLDALGEESVRQAGVFSPAAIQALVERHLSRQANLGYHLWGSLRCISGCGAGASRPTPRKKPVGWSRLLYSCFNRANSKESHNWRLVIDFVGGSAGGGRFRPRCTADFSKIVCDVPRTR